MGRRPIARAAADHEADRALELVAWPIYSERFVTARGPNILTQWVVPAGRRAVVKSIVAVNAGSSPHLWQMFLAGSYAFGDTLPGPDLGRTYAVMQVLYGGQSLGIWTTHIDIAVSVSGYLFDDPNGPDAVPGDVTRELVTRAELQPS